MKEKKTHILTVVSLILLAISLITLGFWGFQGFFSPSPENSGHYSDSPLTAADTRPRHVDSAVVSRAEILSKDSAIDNAALSADSLTALYDQKISEYARLKNEILDLLKSRNGDEDLQQAENKIRELNRKVNELMIRNQDMERENKKLSITLKYLEKLRSRRSQVPIDLPADQKEAEVVKTPVPAAAPEIKLRLQNLVLNAIVTEGVIEKETTEAARTEKFSGYFTCKNQGNESAVAEMYLVVYGPDGKILNNGWESGLFETELGKKPYTCRIRFDCPAGNSSKMNFTVAGNSFEKGKYIVEAFHNGRSMGKTSKYLN